jgi:hypothetical protein
MIGSEPENGARLGGGQGVNQAIHSVIMAGAKMIACAMAAADSNAPQTELKNKESDSQDPRSSQWRRGFFASGPRLFGAD